MAEYGNGRDENGRFVKGHSGGPGRPRRAREEEYLAVLLSECKVEDARKIVASAVSRAKAGDKAAREWLFNYILGKPLERHEVTGANGGLLSIYLSWGDYDAADDGASPETA